ncbi:MAG TPA: hypothetical protein VMW53_08885 [archaeon]|nr:hypothetical protein [archaeon]
MPVWKNSNKSVTKENAKESLVAVKSACFKCENHSNDCVISKTAGEIKAMMETQS